MASIWDSVSRFFGSDHNEKCAALLAKLATTARDCAVHFTATAGQDLDGIRKFEHDGDDIVDEIHEVLDNSFIMRFDINELMRLTDELDDVIDGMKKIATHINIYKAHLSTLQPGALEMIRINERMVKSLHVLIGMLSEKRLSLTGIREIVRTMDEAEAEADRIQADAERALVKQYTPAGANRLEFIGWDRLYQLLEETTDHSKHCGNLVLSLARKEA